MSNNKTPWRPSQNQVNSLINFLIGKIEHENYILSRHFLSLDDLKLHGPDFGFGAIERVVAIVKENEKINKSVQANYNQLELLKMMLDEMSEENMEIVIYFLEKRRYKTTSCHSFKQALFGSKLASKKVQIAQ